MAAIFAGKSTEQTGVSEEKEQPMTGVALCGWYSSGWQRVVRGATL